MRQRPLRASQRRCFSRGLPGVISKQDNAANAPMKHRMAPTYRLWGTTRRDAAASVCRHVCRLLSPSSCSSIATAIPAMDFLSCLQDKQQFSVTA